MQYGLVWCKSWLGEWFLVKTFTTEDVDVSEVEEVLNGEDLNS